MSGTILNVLTILAGSGIGILIGSRFSEQIQQSVVTCLGLVTMVLGMQNALGSKNILIPLLALVIGTIIGELLNVDGGLKGLGGWLQARVAAMSKPGEGSESGAAAARIRFISGFVTASLVFGVGPMAVLGSVQNGIDNSDIRLLAIKSTLDFFASIAFASSLGIGVAFSVVPIFVVQGAFTLVGAGLGSAVGATLGPEAPLIVELSATGGLILLGLGLTLLDIKQPRVANMLPALIIGPLMVVIAAALGINIYP